ncbi:glycosyltransferase family 2 protein [Candidatus Kaiserbacteria bacterium]|nr:glycosyltransferase family 2 protein [Candidatus Kaiserbacteria bacterium]
MAIVVPCFNEETTVAGTINSLLALDYPKSKLSIIAVNDGSTDGTSAVLAQFSNDPRITVLTKENGGKHSAMNLALTKTTADYIGCLDADSFVAPDALKTSMQCLLETGATAVTPAILVNKPTRIIEIIQQAEYALSVFIRRAFASANAVFITPGPFSLFKRDVLKKIGGWKHAHGTEDMEIAMRLQQHHFTITNSPRTRVFTTAPKTVRALYKQRVRWTYGFLMNMWDYRNMLGNRSFGALGTIVLPSALISIGTVLYLTSLVVIYMLNRIWSMFIKVDTVGIAMNPALPTLDPFFINTTSAALLAYVLIGIALGLIWTGKRLSDTKLHPAAVPLYMLAYCWIAPFWLGGALIRASFRAQAPWR